MERQCRVSAQHLGRKCMKIVGIPSSVYHNQLEDSVCKIFDKLDCYIVKDNIEDYHPFKSDSAIVKFSRRKDYKQVLCIKNDLKNVSMADIDFEGNTLIYINQSLCSYFKMLWS